MGVHLRDVELVEQKCSTRSARLEGTLMKRHHKSLLALFVAIGIVGATIGNAGAAVVITGTVGSTGKYLVSGAPISVKKEEGIIKVTFETKTAGFNLSLCLGTIADFNSNTCASDLVGSGGPGFVFLSIIDIEELNGKVLFVRRNVGSGNATFAITME
jgi:hypothetical protein